MALWIASIGADRQAVALMLQERSGSAAVAGADQPCSQSQRSGPPSAAAALPTSRQGPASAWLRMWPMRSALAQLFQPARLVLVRSASSAVVIAPAGASMGATGSAAGFGSGLLSSFATRSVRAASAAARPSLSVDSGLAGAGLLPASSSSMASATSTPGVCWRR